GAFSGRTCERRYMSASPYCFLPLLLSICTLRERLSELPLQGSSPGGLTCCGCRGLGAQAARSSRRCASARIFSLLGRPARVASISPCNTSRCNALRLSACEGRRG